MDVIVSSVHSVPRIEEKLYSEKPWKTSAEGDGMLHPVILNEIVESSKVEISKVIDEEYKKPKQHLEKGEQFSKGNFKFSCIV